MTISLDGEKAFAKHSVSIHDKNAFSKPGIKGTLSMKGFLLNISSKHDESLKALSLRLRKRQRYLSFLLNSKLIVSENIIVYVENLEESINFHKFR